MRKERSVQNTWVGGLSEGSRVGYDGSYQESLGLDYYTDPDKVTGLPRLTKDSGTTVTDLVQWHVFDNQSHWFYGDSGKIYKRILGAWSNPHTVASSSGNGMARFKTFEDYIWYMGDSTLGRIEDSTGTPDFIDELYALTETDAVGVNKTSTANNYTLQTSIPSETASDKFSFTAGDCSISGIGVYVSAKGTGDWTFIIHDSGNTTVGQITVENADVPSAAGFYEFLAEGGISLTSGASYHVHIISTVADGTVGCSTASNLSTALYMVYQYLPTEYRDVDNSQAPIGAYIDWSTAGSNVVVNAPTSIDEGQRIPFTPGKEVLDSIAIAVGNISTTMTVTCTLHNSLNETIATDTYSATTSNTYKNYIVFTFSSPVKLNRDTEYHVHITVNTGTLSLLSSASPSNWAGVYLMTYTTTSEAVWHPMFEYANFLLVGNGNYLMTIDDSEVIDTERLTFPENEAVRSIEVIGDLAVISTWVNDDITSSDRGRVYLWDGVSATYIQYISLSGQVNAMVNDGGANLKVIAGDDGQIRFYNGELPLFRRIKNVERDATIEVYPGAISTWQGYSVFGISDGTSSSVQRVVYILGRKDNDYPVSLNAAFPISTGQTGSTVQIGMVKGISEDELFVSWYDSTSGGSYGVDIIDNDNDQASVYFHTMRSKKDVDREKIYTSVSVVCEPLTSTQTITIKYRKNNSGSYTAFTGSEGTFSYDASKANVYKSFPIPTDDQRAFDMEFEVTLADSGGSLPSLLAFTVEYQVLDEDQIGTV